VHELEIVGDVIEWEIKIARSASCSHPKKDLTSRNQNSGRRKETFLCGGENEEILLESKKRDQ
jgi:hypothetical protein